MRRLFHSFAAGLLGVSGCATPATLNPATAGAPGMVSAADPRAAQAGAEILRAGGSAADAAAATLLALTVVEPQSSGIGGGGFLVYAERGGLPVTFDGRETAPMAAGGDWFITKGKPLTFNQAQPGGKSVGVPSNVRLMALQHSRFGKLPWARLFEPAIRLARDGFVLNERLHRALSGNRDIAAMSPQGRALFYGPDGNPRPVGTVIRNGAFAALLQQLARLGPDSFYVGPNARALVATVNASPVNPSRMTLGDAAAYSAKPRPVVCGEYRRHRICGMGPPSSGATTVFATIKQLERFDLARLGPNSPTSWHLIAESMRLAFADRDRYLGDPDFVAVPVAGLTAEAYLAGRSQLISARATMPRAVPGAPAGSPVVASGLEPNEAGTSHFSVVDRWGSAASQTSTIESAFGSGLMVNGYYLNNELTDFSFLPVKDDLPVANRVEGGKRPRSSMSPTIVYAPDGRVRLVVGAAGGATIIAQVARAIIGFVDWDLSPQQALALPMLFSPGDTLFVERGTYLERMIPQLRALGHSKIELQSPGTYKANAIGWHGGRWAGAVDPRSPGAAVSE